jgi:DNA-binding SARP family transcriptional activator
MLGERSLDRIYVCHECVEQMSGLYGYISPETAEVLSLEREALEESHSAALRKVTELEIQLEATAVIQALLPKKPGPKPKVAV